MNAVSWPMPSIRWPKISNGPASNVEVITQLDPRMPKVMVDPHQVQQVFLNIINNARQAMEAHQIHGCLRISSQACGQLVRILFQDNGPGVSEKNLSKVFDPFFT